MVPQPGDFADHRRYDGRNGVEGAEAARRPCGDPARITPPSARRMGETRNDSPLSIQNATEAPRPCGRGASKVASATAAVDGYCDALLPFVVSGTHFVAWRSYLKPGADFRSFLVVFIVR